MRTTKKHHFYILLVVGILLGLGVGYKIHRDRIAALEGRIKPDSSLRILALKGLFPRELVQSFERDHGVRLILSEAETPEALWDRFETPGESFDLVSLFSYQIPIAIQAGRLFAPEPARLRGWDRISADFRNVPGETTNQETVPLLWGLSGMLYDTRKIKTPPDSWHAVLAQTQGKNKVALLSADIELARWLPEPEEGDEESEEAPTNESVRRALAPVLSSAVLSENPWSSLSLVSQDLFSAIQMNHGETAFLTSEQAAHWKFVWPEEKAGFWILSLALTRGLKDRDDAYRFLDFLLEGENSARLANWTHQASTNRAVESLAIDARLKPSYLRQAPLTRLQILRDFQGARSVRAALGAITAPRSH